MKNLIKNLYLVIMIFCFSTVFLYSKTNFFNEAKILFEDKKYNKSKFLFEKDIVHNPKNEKSYLYLAKIFKKEKNDNLLENNLNTVLVLNPKNEEAIYLLTLLNIKKSNFLKAKELMATMNSVCVKLCTTKKELKKKLDNSLKSQ